MAQQNKIDYTKNGECSMCGRCCSNILCVSDREIATIKKYLKAHPEVPVRNFNSILNNEYVDKCPFQSDEHKCNVYEVRPEICRRFICASYLQEQEHLNHRDKHVTNMYEAFSGKKCPNAPDIKVLEENYERQKRLAYGK